jgi:hypothetical protein
MTEKPPTRRRYQFGLATLLFLVLPVSILAGALGGMLQPGTTGVRLPRSFFVILAVMAPLGLMIAVSLVRAAATWLSGRGGR